MHRIDTDGNVSNLFNEGDPQVPRNPTQVSDDWLNAVQEELCNAIENAGITLVKGTWTQLRSAMANLTTAQSFTAVKTFARGLIASKLTGATGTTIDATGAEGEFVGANGGTGGDAVKGTGGAGEGGTAGRGGNFIGGAGDEGEAAGPGVRAKGGAGASSGSAGVGVVAEGGAEFGGGYGAAVHATHGDIAIDDGAITVANAGSEIALEALQTPTLINSWVDVGGNYTATKYYKDPFGIVHIEGGVKSGTSGTVAFTLPSGYRPSAYRYFVSRSFESSGNDGYAEFEVRTNGDVVVFRDSDTTDCFLECSFRV